MSAFKSLRVFAIATALALIVPGPAHAAGVVSVSFLGYCTVTPGMSFPPPLSGPTQSFSCSAGSSYGGSNPTMVVAGFADVPGKDYQTFGSKKTGGFACVRPGGPCGAGLTISAGVMTALQVDDVDVGPRCGFAVGELDAEILPRNAVISADWVMVGDAMTISGSIFHGQAAGPFEAHAHFLPNPFTVANDNCVLDPAMKFMIVGTGAGWKAGVGLPPSDSK